MTANSMELHCMPDKNFRYFDVLAAKAAYEEGKNVTELLRRQQGLDFNSPSIIETAYDLQAGSYISHVKADPETAKRYTSEIAALLDRHLEPDGSLLDVGTGELTTFSLLTKELTVKPAKLLAFDISWSRIFVGLGFAKEHMGSAFDTLTAFAGDIGEIPLPDKSVDFTTSSHALEPNGPRLKELMGELFRITAKKLVLFEPCYEINSDEGKQRMDRLGYIKGVDDVIAELGGTLLDKVIITNVGNPLNPTVGFVIAPPGHGHAFASRNEANSASFSVPGTNMRLEPVDNFYFSKETGLCYPVLKGIPILKSNAAVLATLLTV